METADLLIVGGGQSGLSTAHIATRLGLKPVVLEASPEPAGSWPGYYDSLTLFSPARYSALPGRPFPGDPDRYPTRDEVAAYLRDYAVNLDADIRTNTRVQTVTRHDDGTLRVTTDHGGLHAPIVIAATGGFGNPHHPALPGLDTYTGQVVHAADYRNPKDFADQRVVVVGGGNSAVQIAVDLADTARVTLATRGPLKWAKQRVLGIDLHWWLTHTGLDAAPLSRVLGGKTMAVIDDGRYKAALATGNPDHRPMFATLAETGVTWTDGTSEHLDAVILATGYRPNLDYLRGLGALDGDGKPLHRHGISTTTLGLGYVGLEWQRSLSSASLRGASRDAEFILKRLRRK